jgi:hypothetical protein
MWGAEDSPLQIELNGAIVEIRNNLWQALHQLRHTVKTQTLWVDALCIDQDDTSERNHQVSQMGRIYQNIQYVVAWLGTHGELSKVAMKYFSLSTEHYTLQKPLVARV